MKIAIAHILSSAFFILSCASPKENECKQLRRGEFYYKASDSFGGSTIRRNDSIQLVKDNETGKEQLEWIVWIEPCIYMLYPLPEKKDTTLFPVKVTVLEVAEKYYRAQVYSKEYKADFTDTVWIANNATP